MRLVIICLSALSLGGCGTIVRGSTETVAFNSNPSGASVRTSLGSGCPTTPCVLEIPRKSEFTAIFSMPGHSDVTVPVLTKVSGGGGASMAGNVLLGGIIGVGVDAANGTAYDHEPNPVFANMAPLGAPPAVLQTRPRRAKPVRAPAVAPVPAT